MKIILKLAILVFLPICLGCGGGIPGLVVGQGQVTIDGKPVDGASVVFFSQGDDGMMAVATTSPDGKFNLFTKESPGVRPGSYSILVTKQVSLAEHDASKANEGGKEDFPTMKKMTSSGKTKQLLPEAYSDLKTTPLNIEIPASGNPKIEIKLTSEGK